LKRKDESLLKIKHELMDRLMNLKNIDPTDRLEIGLLILELLEPEDYEDYRRVLQKEHYRKRRR